MSADPESVALRWAERHLRSHRCDKCGGVWITRRSVGVIFHQCEPSVRRRRRSVSTRSPEERREAERVEWARRKLGPIASSLEETLGEAALRPVEPDE